MGVGRFLGGVGILLKQEATGEYLLLRRTAVKDFAAGVWECVTGRVDQGEGFEEAAYRELFEETGLRDICLAYILGTTHFYRGAPVPENELIGVVFVALVDGPVEIRLSEEHSEFRWVTAVAAQSLLPLDNPSAAWVRRVIARAEKVSPQFPANLIAFNQDSGFELG